MARPLCEICHAKKVIRYGLPAPWWECPFEKRADHVKVREREKVKDDDIEKAKQ